jgi:LacI family transcriptional regulator
MALSPQALPREKRVQIADLAAHLGVTKGTVSRALNGYPDIAESTRLRVQKAAQQLGYRPLTHAQAIRTGRVRSLGLILQMDEHDGHRPFVAEFLAGLSEGASEEDWTMTVATAASDKDTLRLLEDLSDQKKADGFIVPRTRLDDPRIDFLRERSIPFVLFGRTRNGEGCAWFDIESEAAMRDAVARLSGLGHRRIGFIPGAPGYTYATLRLDGYREGLKACGISYEESYVSGPAVTRAQGAEAARGLIAAGATAIVSAVDEAALGIYDAAREAGLRVGRDLSIISYDGVPEGALIEPALSTYRVDTRDAGRRLAAKLIRLCRGEDAETLRALAQAQFLERGSHGTAPTGLHPREEDT